MDRSKRLLKLKKALSKRIMVIDGAIGTFFQSKKLTIKDYGDVKHEGCYEYLSVKRPDLLRELHNSYLEVGVDILTTNTFGASPIVLREYALEDLCYQINFNAVTIARECADKVSGCRFVAGSIGPTTKLLSVTGGINFNELSENYDQQVEALYDAGVDYFLVETCQDTRNIKAALDSIERVLAYKEIKIPIAVSITIEPSGTMLAGQTPEALLSSLEHLDLLYVGINCSTGPENMGGHLKVLSDLSNSYVGIVPNAGLPNENGEYLESAERFSKIINQFADQGYLNLVGGCCGTTPEHIKEVVSCVKGKKGRKVKERRISSLSGIDYLEIDNANRPYLVGERANVIGSRKFKNLILDKRFDEASDIAKLQVKKGAHIIDLCLSNPDSNELEDMKSFLELIIKKVKIPLMIDSLDPKVIELSLSFCQGKSIINSINLEEGEKKFQSVIPLAKKFGAALVVSTIDDDPKSGMAVTTDRKMEIVRRSYKLLTEKYRVRPQNIFFDPLVFPLGTGDENYGDSAIQTINAVKRINKEFPEAKTVLGISNVSFGLPMSGREVLNSVYLYHAVEAGLDLAIVNTEKIKRFSSITEEEKKLAENLMWNIGENPVQEFIDYFRGKVTKQVDSNFKNEGISVEEKISNLVVEGFREELRNNIDEVLKEKKMAPLEVINGPLMNGMNLVGRLFFERKLIITEVLQSAEVMKSGIDYLKPLIEDPEATCRGKMILATVKGDVHDIGKNLVEIIFSNNGIDVIDLGIKVGSEKIIEACKEHTPDMIGLSGLIIKSAHQMVDTCRELKMAGIDIPVLIGGAALSESFVAKSIAKEYAGPVYYAKDAMAGLSLANGILS